MCWTKSMRIRSTLQVCSEPGLKEDSLSYRDRILLSRVRRRGGALVKMPTPQLGRGQVQKTTHASFVLANEFESSRYSRLCSEDSLCSRQNSLGGEPSMIQHKHPLWPDMKGEAVSYLLKDTNQYWTATLSSCILPESYNY